MGAHQSRPLQRTLAASISAAIAASSDAAERDVVSASANQPTNQPTERIRQPTWCLICHCHGHPGREPLFWAVTRPARPYNSAIENLFTVEYAKAA